MKQLTHAIDPALFKDLSIDDRVLMGPGPSNVPARVLGALARPCIGHLDPDFLAAMNETQLLLRYLFQTANALTIPVSGTGSAGMEACLVNLVQPGDEVVVAVNGVFGTRLCDIVGRIGGQLRRIDAEWGRAVDPALVERALQSCRRPRLLAVVHAETSTGACTPLADMAALAHRAGALLLADCVTSLGGLPLGIDELQIDAAYSGTQKCISCPPGLAPVTFGPRAVQVLEQRSQPVVSWYLDLSMVRDYWGRQRKYHHTAPINMVFALREALRLIAEEGLEARWRRHLLHHQALVAGVEALGLEMLVPAQERLPMLNSLRIPPGVDDQRVRQALLRQFGIEIGGGLGPFAGKVWRVGLMGHSCCRRNVSLLLAGLQSILVEQGFQAGTEALSAAAAVYARHPGEAPGE